MIKRITIKVTHSVTIIALALLVGFPFVSSAVVLTAVDVYISNTPTTLKIEGVTVDKLVVNTTSTVITMTAGGNAVTITNTDRYKFTVAGISDPGTTCGAGSSSIILPSQGSATEVTITPSTVCPSGGGGGGSPVVSSPPPATAAPIPSTTTGSVTATATQGGNTTITTSEGTTAGVDIPAVALSGDTTVVVAPIAKTSATVATAISAVPATSQIVGSNIYDYTATVASSAVSTFAADLTLNFTYTDAQVAGLSLSSLKVYYYDTATGAWVALPTTVNTTTKAISATTNHFTYFAIFGSTEVGDMTTTDEGVNFVDINGVALADGDLITTATSFDIYIVKYVESKAFKRLILNPDIFNSYGHLSWDNVKTVSQEVQDAHTLADLIIEVNEDGSVADPKVYKVSSALDADVGTKQWLNMTAIQFVAEGYDWDAIYKVNHTEASANFYPEGSAITSTK